ncbi:MAG: hypothetical protein KAT00_13295 [Planctomycetes bacterium]|nr:hypothetical protein [Planctomycetota bacterium]
MNDSSLPNPLALLFGQEEQKTRRALVRDAAVFAGILAIPFQSTLADIPIDLPSEHLAKNEILKGLPRLNLMGLTGQDSAICTNPPEGNLNDDCCVDIDDLRIMQSDWLTTDSSARSNLDSGYSYIPGPGSASTRVYVDYLDFRILAENWQKCGQE